MANRIVRIPEVEALRIAMLLERVTRLTAQINAALETRELTQRALNTLSDRYGLGGKQVLVVAEEGGQYLVGTVLDAKTGAPLMVADPDPSAETPAPTSTGVS